MQMLTYELSGKPISASALIASSDLQHCQVVCGVPAVAEWGTGSYDFLDCEASDCLMRHDVSVTVCPSTQTESEGTFGPELYPFLPFISRDCDANDCLMRRDGSVTVIPLASRLRFPSKSAARRDTSRKWNVSKQRWNLC